MRVVKAFDINGRPYKAYEVKLPDGSYVHVDKVLADLTGDAEALVAAEVVAHEAQDATTH